MGSSQSVISSDDSKSESFDWDHPVIRRGNMFSFSFQQETVQSLQEYSEKVNLIMKANGDFVDENKLLYTADENSHSKWKVHIIRTPGNNPICQLESPPDCDMGEYEVAFKIGDKVLNSQKFLMLCNPWNKDDEAYLADEAEINEYVLNPKTVIYYGHPDYIKSANWCVGQFTRSAIQTLLVILKKVSKPSRSCLYKFAREVTAMITNIDENGILEFTLERKSYDGTNPENWNGSKAIFSKYIKEGKTVKYGHGIAITGVLCSIFRVAGIPAKPVTGFSCAHDNDGTMDLEVYYDENYKLILERSQDRVYTFHTWVECSMKYPCLDKYDGWHVCDATPKKTTTNPRLTCGPAPVAAVKGGELNVGFDTKYIYSEVNARILQMVVIDGKPETFLEQDTIIGKKIVTKAIASGEPLDITDHYKHDPGSVLNKVSRINANASEAEYHDKELTLVLENVSKKNSILLGKNLELKPELLHCHDKQIDVIFKCFIIHHPNILSGEIMSQTIRMGGKKIKKDLFKVDAKRILDHVKSDSCILVVEAFFSEDGKFFRKEVRYPIETPPISIVLPNKVVVDKSCPVVVKMDNSLSRDLENVYVSVDTDFCYENKDTLIEKVNKSGTINAKFNVMPKITGNYEIRVVIHGPNIPTLHGIKPVKII